ncbi:MAG: amino acid adenylation domain-containing protein [Ignavibacteria bacterium]|jgi:amino acid adenylation domain-containing protein|nr:amino acid adenylation domain-containing protein [Ignavibacteria bacterium]
MNTNIEDIYPLSPMQRGMLFHSLLSSETGVYIEQTSCTFHGPMDIYSFKCAWEKVAERHQVLRSAFMWEDVDEPLQIVYKDVELPFKILDWQNEAGKEEKLEELLRLEVEEGFALENAPLMKLVIIKADTDLHYFIWTQHHILFDGWSAQIIIKEVFEVYNALINNSTARLNVVRPFRDYISWLQRQDIKKAEAFWRITLEDLSNNTSFRPRAFRKREGGYMRRNVEINSEISSLVNAFCRKNRLTINTLFQGFWALILASYTGHDDIVFGSTVSGRPTDLLNIDSTVGLFINTLPVRIKIEPEITLAAWLRNIQFQQAEQRKYEYCALTDIQGWSRIPREVPLFDSIIVFENYPASAALSRLKEKISIDEVRSHTRTNYPLTIALGVGEEISIEMAYDESFFDSEEIEALFSHFKALLSSVSLNAEKKLNEISILSDEESNRILREFSHGADALALEDISIPECFKSVAAIYGNMTACCKNDSKISYRELDEKADRLAHNLISNGLVLEDIVAIVSERSVDMIVSIMAVLRSGGAFLPIDPSYPVDRISYMIEDSDVKLILTQKHLLDKIPVTSKKVILMDSEEELYSSGGNHTEVKIHPENLAYVIYTSGSTGKPKGTMLSHKGVINLARVKKEILRLSSGKRVLQFSSFSFDASICEIFMSLLTGSTLCLCDKEDILSGGRLMNLMSEQKINFLLLPPSYLSVLPDKDLPDLEVLVTGGEAATWSLIEKWSKGRKYFNAYGPTEATVCTTLHECSLEDMDLSQTPPIGRAISNLRTYILDRSMHPVPVGAPGELFIAGVGLARGYLGKPELTAEKFLPDPFSGEKGSRLYRTGDMVRYLKDGKIEFLGRMDSQIKLRGFRIELQEIESQIRSYAGVKEAVVVLREDNIGGSRLVAYIVAEEEDFDTSGLQAYLKTKLPEYMLPKFIIRLEKMPLNTSGKIDRSGLPEPEVKQDNSGHEKQKTVTEEILANIWADILKLDKVAAGDNFFELGGHSLLATQLISRIRDAFSIEIPFNILFEEKTLSALAERIDRIVRSDMEVPDKPVKYDVAEKIPLSFPQQRLWFLDKLQPGMTSYNIPAAVKIIGEINLSLLTEAVNTVAGRHQVLKTLFREIDGQPVQVINHDFRADIKITDLKDTAGENRLKEVDRIMDTETSRPFNLQEGPLFRIHILLLSKDECIILFVIHHIIADGWSMSILVNEVASAYEALIKNKNLALPELNLQYTDYSIWQNRMYEAGKFSQQLNYWKDKLSNIPQVSGLYTDFPRKPILSVNGNSASDILDTDTLKELLELSRKEGATLFMSLLAAFNILLHKYSGQYNISIGAPVAGRVRTEIENLIGFFVNNVVLLTELERGLTFKELLKKVRTTSLEAYANQDVPFEKVVEAVAPLRDLSRSPLFQVMFVFQNFRTNGFDLEDLQISSYPIRSTTSNFDLSMVLNESEEGLMMALEYNSDLFKPETIELMLRHYKNIIKSVLLDPDVTIEDLNILLPAEEDKILRGWNSTAMQYPPVSVVERFNEVVNENPACNSVVMAASDGTILEELSYSGLNIRSERLASLLMRNQIGREDIVAIVSERSVDMIVSIMAVLRSGGAFLPIDPSYPVDRISYMIEDSDVKLILTQKHLLDKIPVTSKKVILMDSEEELYSSGGNHTEVKIHPENLAYVIYTSGSTGKPKGTMLSHKGVVNLSYVQKESFSLSPGERVMQFSSLSFDASVWEIFMALLSGSTLYLCRRDTTLSGEKLRDYLKNNGINVLTLPPSVLSFIPYDILSELDVLVTAGEAAAWSLIEKWSKGRKYFNAYGPTEATVCTTLHECSLEDMDLSQTPPIGRAISNLRTYILDRSMHPVPVGAPGELFIAGVGLARGYLGKPELTAEKFLPDPFSGEKGSRLYRTGDMVRYLKDGKIEFLGRMDSQIKLRGFRIELQEIESQIRSYAGVKEAVVVLREDNIGGSRLVAYIVAEEEDFDTSGLQAYLKTKLPEYMLPKFIIRLEKMPLNTSGKIDRNGLAAMDPGHAAKKVEYTAPRTRTEKAVTDIASGLLNLEKAGIYDNFFELGGHSLLASQLVSRIREAVGIEIPLRLVFEKPVFADLALEIELLEKGNDERKDETIKRVSRDSYRAVKSDLIK